MNILFIADGKMYRCEEGGKACEIPSTVLEGYIDRVHQNAKRNEWKRSGSGAMFIGTYDPNADAESRIASISASVGGMALVGDTLYYSQTIDETSGIYAKRSREQDGIVVSDGTTIYREIDEKDGRLVVAASFGGESHIGLVTPGSPAFDEVTEGETRDRHPVWSRFEKDVIYYSSAGLAIRDKEDGNAPQDGSLPARMRQANEDAFRGVGPASLCRLDLARADTEEMFSDPAYDFIKPATDDRGNLYFIRRPYNNTLNKNVTFGGCLLDILLFPVRLIGALLGFLNFFSMLFSGKTIRKSGDTVAQSKDPSRMYIEGNLIEADKELKKNAKKEKNPGIIPRSYELCRYGSDRKITVLKKGVIAYRVTADGILVSNGSFLLLLKEDGQEQKICDTSRITSIYEERRD